MAKRKPKRKRTPARRNLDRSKSHERRVARWFGTVRTPLSGGASRHTRSDTLHPRLYVEVKGAQGPTGTNGWLWRWLEKLKPEMASADVMPSVGLGLVSSQCVDGLMPRWMSTFSCDVPKAARALWADTEGKARGERKIPVLALVLKGRRGFWLMSTNMDAVHNAREEVLRAQEG